MKLSRRELVIAASGSVTALAQTPAPGPVDPLQAARDSNKRSSDALTRFEIPIATEPAFQFKA